MEAPVAPKRTKHSRRKAGDTNKHLGWIALGGMIAVSLAAIVILHGRQAPASRASVAASAPTPVPAPQEHVAEIHQEPIPASMFASAANAPAVSPASKALTENPIQPVTAKMSPKQWRSLDEVFAEQLRHCWTAPAQVDEDRPYVAKIKVDFSPDGALLDKPTLINTPSDPAWKAQAALALKALKNCKQLNIPASYQPYYAEWKTRIINFDPTL